MDYYSDSGHTFAKLFVNYELPDFVKSASALDDTERKALSKTAFADQENRLFPIQDPAQVFTSAAYALAQPGEVSPDVLKRIKRAARTFKIEPEVQRLEEHVQNLFATPNEVKEASFEGPKKAPFAIEFKSAGIDRIEGIGPEGVKRAEARFLNAWKQIDPAKRAQIAQDLLVAGSENATELSDEVQKFAGLAEIDHNYLRGQFSLRLGCVTDALVKSAAATKFNGKMAELAAAKGEDVKKVAMEIVTFLADFDQTNKTARFYGERLDGPHQAVFNKIAKADKLLVVGRHSFPGNIWHGDGCTFDQAIRTVLGDKAAELKTAGGEYDPEKLKALGDAEADLIKRLVG